jgi:hypothetical protein
MKLAEVVNPDGQSLVEAIKKIFDEALGVRHSRLESIIGIYENKVSFEVEFEFPEHLVRGAAIKKVGKPFVAKVTVEKSELWREGVFGALYEVTLTQEIPANDAKKLTDELKKLYKIK